ncbi:hypothetical protein U9M48_002433 [Paspalum notatum var. saurae]|uniref:Uncharacterized protein n=1 Tax=Paspalum notatum var. saurae TaxID=547442 RepID=A0AAQ3PQK8_PASNO
MAPEPEGSGEVADGVFLKGYEVAVKKMHGLSISSSTVPQEEEEEEEEAEEQQRGRGLAHFAHPLRRGRFHRQPSHVAVLLRQIRQRSSPTGDASQRLAYCFARGLELRLVGQQGQRSLVPAKPKRTSAAEFLKAYQLYLQVCCFEMAAFKFSIEATQGRKKVHIVDYGKHHGFQWPLLLHALADREGGLQEVEAPNLSGAACLEEPAPEDPTEPEPFSPSVFLDLPPTPRPDGGDGDGEDAASSEDLLALPFIRRMLMEEDANDKNVIFYQRHPDHPALLQAEEPFAQILSGSAATSSWHTTTNTTGSSTFTISPASADVPAFAGATWPYDPDKLAQVLQLQQSVEGEAIQSSCCFQFQDGAAEEPLPGGDGVTMDMINQAFIKGMEEANKFLPINAATNSLLLPSDGVLPFSRGRGCKNKQSWDWDWDDDDDDDTEAEATRRSAKLMAPEPEESGEAADSVFLEGYELALEKMHSLSITSGSVPPSAEERQRCSNEAVDLRTLLTHCAEAVSTGNRLSATELLQQIKQRSSPTGDASQRLAHCFAQGLELRLAGTAKPKPKLLPVPSLLKAYHLYLQVCCFHMAAFKFSHAAIWKATAGRKKVHIVDYGEHHGFQWPLLLHALAVRDGGPPEVRVTAIACPQPGFRPAARIQETGRRLTEFARQRGVPFRFRSIVAARWETVCADDVDIQPDEVLFVNGLFHFSRLMDEGVDIDSPSPRDMVLANIRTTRPDVFILCVDNSSYGAPFFVTRFREALFYYSAMFDMMDATAAPRDSAERLVVEQEILGRCALNAIACEGSERVERPETFKQWQVRCSRAGLRQLPLHPARGSRTGGYHKDFVIDVDQQWLLQGWKGRILYAMSTWAADDSLPSS